jgi:hypothetical protein
MGNVLAILNIAPRRTRVNLDWLKYSANCEWACRRERESPVALFGKGRFPGAEIAFRGVWASLGL